jgi:RNA polymerase sigma-70 factor (ECF subfamily)
MYPHAQGITLPMHDPGIDNQLRELLPRLRRFARWLTRDANSADDLVQSTLERGLSRWESRRDETALRPWLYAIAWRQFLDGKRHARRYAAMLELLGRSAPAEQPSLEREVIAQSVVQALDRLPDEQRHLLLWISVEGLSYQEVADLLGIPIGTVMSRLSRARAALRRLSDGETPMTPALRLLK